MQVAGLYTQCLAELGHITITEDAAYLGESGGKPRSVDIPAYRIEDIHGMADFIIRQPEHRSHQSATRFQHHPQKEYHTWQPTVSESSSPPCLP